MKRQLFCVLILMIIFGSANAQKKVKEEKFVADVLVIGNGNAAAAAGIQSAISGVKTMILLQAGGFDLVSGENDLSSGLEATFLKHYKALGKAPGSFDKMDANLVLMKLADSVKNLRVIKNVMWVKAERSGNNWSFKLSDGSAVRPKVLINPADAKLNEALKIASPAKTDWTKLAYDNNIYRTSVASGKVVSGSTVNIFSLYQLLVPMQENLVWISDPESMALGQAAGATAAYAAYYNTKTSLSNLKKIQGELVNYKLNLMPFADVKYPDTNWKAIQFVGITGVLKGNMSAKELLFAPDQVVTTMEIKQPIKDYYYKAQIWFDDYKATNMTIASTIDMVCYVGNKSLESTKRELEKKWKTSYKFKSEFTLDRLINRREFAVILQDYMPPFNVNIDQAGKVVR